MKLEDAEIRAAEIAAAREDVLGVAVAYARSRLAPELGASGDRLAVSPAATGLRSLVFFVAVDGRPRLVLRLVKSRDDARWLAAAVDLFAAHGLSAPRPVARDIGFWARWRWGWHVFVEEAVAGEPLGPATSIPAVEAMGRAYAAVHAVRSKGWGRVDAPQVGGFVADRRRRLAGLAGEVRSVAPAALRPAIERLLGELDTEPLEEPQELSLCHNRVTPDNVLLTAEGGCTLIDLERVKLGSHLQEVASLEFDVFAEDAARFQAFLASYTAAAPVALQPASDARTWLWYRLVAGLKKLRDLSAGGREAEAEGWLRRLPLL